MKTVIFLAAALVFSAHSGGAQVVAKTAKRCVVTDSGAVADGKTVNTHAIQAAIDKCAGTGGGVLVIPKGTFLTGSIFLKQGVNLLVEKDGVLKGTTNPDDYPTVNIRMGGTDDMAIAALVNANGLTDLDISGDGTIDGSGEQWEQNNPRRPPGSAQGGPTPAATGRGRPKLIEIQNSKRVRVANLNLHNQANWCLFFFSSENVLADGLHITAEHNIPSSDGIDIDSSKTVRVNNVYIDVDDDCISIKSGKDPEAPRRKPSEDIVIENSHFAYGQGGVAMGSETAGGIRNVEVRNCVFDLGNWAPIRFKSQPSHGGVVENITYRDLTVHGTRQAFEFNLEWRMVPPILPPAKVLPVVRNVKIINVSGDVQSVGVMHGMADSPIQGVTFQNCHITAQRGFRLEHARGVDLTGLTLDVKDGEAITKTDVQ